MSGDAPESAGMIDPGGNRQQSEAEQSAQRSDTENFLQSTEMHWTLSGLAVGSVAPKCA
jgi:hypothetical protein